MRIILALILAFPLYSLANEVSEYIIIFLIQVLAGLDTSLFNRD